MRKSKYASKEFDINDLPINRRKQFFDIFKNEWKTLLKIGFILLAISILYFALDIIKNIYASSIEKALINNNASETEIYNSKAFISLIYYAILIPYFIIIAIPLAGISRVIYNLAYGEGVLFKLDFVKGVKLNSKQFIFIAIIFGILNFVYGVNISYLYNHDLLSQILRGLTIGLFYFVVIPIVFFSISQSVIYKNKLSQILINSLKYLIMCFVFALIFSFILLAIRFLNLIPNIIIKDIFIALIILLLGPIYLLSWHLFSISRFDKYVNKNHYKEIYRKGLSPDIFDKGE